MPMTRIGKPKHALRRDHRTYPAVADVGMVILDENYRPVAFDHGAAEMFHAEARRAVGGTAPAFLLPKEFVDVVRRARPGDPSSPKLRFHLGSSDYSCRCYMLQDAMMHGPNGGMMAVHVERDVAVYDAVSEVGSEYNLTDREHEVLKQIASGLTSKEVAQRM